MAILTLSTIVAATLGDMKIGQRDYSLAGGSDATGEMQTRLYGPPRWVVTLQSTDRLDLDELGEWESLVMRLRGRVNHLRVYDVMRPAPRGTLRGTLTLASACAVGDTTILIAGGAGQAGATLKSGDALQLGTGLGTSQYVKAVAPAVADGSGDIVAVVEPPCRVSLASGSSVTWNKPTIYTKLESALPSWTLLAGEPQATGFALDLLEQWS